MTNDTLTFWCIAFVLTDAIQMALVAPRMFSYNSSNMNKIISISYVIAVIGDTYWHIEHEDNDMAINIASIFYLIGTLPFVYSFFRTSNADRGLKMRMAIIYMINLWTFGDPTNTSAPLFFEKHLANHLGSTLFYYVAVDAKYQEKEEIKKSN